MNKYIEYIKLLHRARKYRYHEDIGGIQYLLDSIKPGDTVLDIGAHKGAYTYYMRQAVGPKGAVYAFEPQHKLYAYLLKLQKLFKWRNVGLYSFALAEESTEMDLYIPNNKHGIGSSPGATLNVPENANREMIQSVLTLTLDQICSERNIHPSFLKIDAEGSELAIFRGGVWMLREYHPKILVEIEARHVGREQAQATFDFLLALKYKGYFISPMHSRMPIEYFNFDIFQDTKDMKRYCNNFIFE